MYGLGPAANEMPRHRTNGPAGHAVKEVPDFGQLVRPTLASVRPFVPELADLPVEEIKKRLGRSEVAKLSFNENPYGPSPKAVEAMQKAAASLHFYQDSTGAALRQSLSQVLVVDPESIILSNGADEMIMLVALAFLSPGDEVVIPSPTFGQYAVSTKLMGAVPIIVPLKDFRVDVQAALDAVNEKTKLVFLCNPNNPTGTILARDELEQLLSSIPKNVIVVVDEAYIDYVTDASYESAVAFLDRYPNILVIRTFSKLHGLAAARVGFGIGRVELIRLLHRVRPPFNVNGVAQAGAKASLEDTSYQEQTKHLNTENRRYLYSMLDDLELSYVPSQTNFVLVDTGRDSGQVFSQLLQYGVVVRDAGGHGLPTSLRITVGTRDQLELLYRGLKALGF